MKHRFVKSSEKKQILKKLNEQFGIEKLDYLLIESGKQKFRGYTGTLSKEEISELDSLTNIETIGTYLIKEENDLRLSLDATHLLKNQITKNIIEIDDKQLDQWMRGFDIELEKEITPGVKVIKYKNDFIGCTKTNGKILFNYVPKERRIKGQ